MVLAKDTLGPAINSKLKTNTHDKQYSFVLNIIAPPFVSVRQQRQLPTITKVERFIFLENL
jgi:hypothetical protein